nr:enoyl-CoA hydratase/isomerase family protein [Actinomycetota bacterium]
MIDLDIDTTSGGAAVAHIVLNNPAKLNALDEQAVRDLGDAYAEAERAGVRALVLRGEGRAFCAGRDISDV